jgi:DNA-directed RNA polymerase specialized sigma24 family protein
MRVDLERATARLTSKQRLALWLWVLGYSHEEIADQCDVGRTAITMRISRARETIQEGQT